MGKILTGRHVSDRDSLQYWGERFMVRWGADASRWPWQIGCVCGCHETIGPVISPRTAIKERRRRAARIVGLVIQLTIRYWPLSCCRPRKYKNVFLFYITFQNWNEACSWNTSPCKTRAQIYYIVNGMVVDVLATQVAKASRAMVLP